MVFVLVWITGDASNLSCQSVYQAHLVYIACLVVWSEEKSVSLSFSFWLDDSLKLERSPFKIQLQTLNFKKSFWILIRQEISEQTWCSVISLFHCHQHIVAWFATMFCDITCLKWRNGTKMSAPCWKMEGFVWKAHQNGLGWLWHYTSWSRCQMPDQGVCCCIATDH